MESVKIIEEMITSRTGRPPTKMLKIVEYLMSFPYREVTVRDVSTSLHLRASTVNDAFRKLEKLGYLDKGRVNKKTYVKERLIKTGKKDVHRLPYNYKLSDKFRSDFNACRADIQKRAEERFTNIQKGAQEELADSQILNRILLCEARAHIALRWAGIWDTDFGLLEIKDGYPTTGKYPGGRIEGNAISDTLKGTWYEGAKSGSFEFKRGDGRNSFSGKRFGNINQRLGEWNGTLLEP